MLNKSENRPKVDVMAIVLIVVIPLIHWKYLIDWDYLPKFLAYTLVSVFILTRALINRWSIPVPSFRFAWLWWLGYGLMMGFSLYRSINIDLGILEFSKLNLLLLLMIVLYIYHNRMAKGDTFYYFNFTVLLLVFFAVLDFYELGRLDPDSVNFFRVDLEIRSTLANKNFLAEALVLMAPFIASNTIDNSKFRKQISRITFIMLIVSVFFLQSASAIVSLFVFLVVLFVLQFKWNSWYMNAYESKGKIIGLILAAIVVILSLAIIRQFGLFDTFSKKWKYFEKYALAEPNTYTEEEEIYNENSVYDRIVLYRNSLAIAADAPFIGIGTSNWIIQSAKYGWAGARHLNGGIIHFEHPHNEYLLILCEYGLWGLGFFLITIFFLGFIGIKVYRKSFLKEERFRFACILAGLCSSLILMFFGYPLHRPFSTFLLAYLISFILFHYQKSVAKREPVGLSTKFFLAFIIIGLFFMLFGLERLKGEWGLVKSQEYRSKGRFPLMYSSLIGNSSAFYQVDDYGTPIAWYCGLAKSYSGDMILASNYFQDAAKKNPYHVQVLSDLGALYVNRGDYSKAMEYLSRAVLVVPRHCESNFNLGIAYYNSGKIKEAKEFVFRAACPDTMIKQAQKVVLRSYLTSCSDTLNPDQKRIINTILADSLKFDSVWSTCRSGFPIFAP